jgi:predicted glutamine amidotransferase
MCRWMAYSGNSIPLDEMLFKTDYSLIDQSMSAKLAPQPTNGDGFGIGWYGRGGRPGLYRSTQPAWNDANLQDISHHLESELFFAHVRRSTGTPVQQSNCHPFRHRKWLFVHNGLIYGYDRVRRGMLLEIAPELFSEIRGSADSELMFYVAITYGLHNDPIGALAKMVGLVERLGHEAGIEHPMQMTVGVSDGETLYSVRYSSVRDSLSLFYTTDTAKVRDLYPENPGLELVGDTARLITSEPTSDLEGMWNPVPESTAVIVKAGNIELRPFESSAP